MPFEKAGDAIFLLEAEGIEAGKRYTAPWEMTLTGKVPGMPTTFPGREAILPIDDLPKARPKKALPFLKEKTIDMFFEKGWTSLTLL